MAERVGASPSSAQPSAAAPSSGLPRAGSMQIPAMRQPEKGAFHHRRIFGLDGESGEQAYGGALQHDGAPVAPLGQHRQAQRRPAGSGHEQIVEDRGLPAPTAEKSQPQEIGDRCCPRAERAGAQPSCGKRDQPGGRRSEQRRGPLIGEDAVARQQPHAFEQQEQPQRLAIPEIDIRQRPAQHPVADQQIILLVDMNHRVAEVMCAQRDGEQHEQKQHHGRVQQGRRVLTREQGYPIFHAVPSTYG